MWVGTQENQLKGTFSEIYDNNRYSIKIRLGLRLLNMLFVHISI